LTTSTTNITVASVTVVSPTTVQLVYSNGQQPIIESSAGSIVYSMGANCSGWQFVGVVPAPPSDVTYSVSAGGSVLTFVDADTISETFNFCFLVSNGSTTYTSQDPEIINKPPK
jgi:hypothetical protein